MIDQTIVIAPHTQRAIQPDAVLNLYKTVGWPWVNRQADLLAIVLDSEPAIGGWHGDQLIGFARAVTDGHFRAYIEDVAVHPAYQRQGIGRQLLGCLLGILAHIDTISLFCQTDLVPFYTDLGFVPRGNQFVLHRSAPQ